MNKNQISFLIIFIGIILIYVDLFIRYKKKDNKVKEKIIYKYIPRTMREEWDEPVFPSDIFETMFSQKSQWIDSFNDYDSRAKKREVNQYFISQV